VARISLIHDYELELSETVPEIGASTLHTAGLTGEGIIVAVIDSGVDYTHKAFGGPGTVAAWEEAYFGDDPNCLFDPRACAHSLHPPPPILAPAHPRSSAGLIGWARRGPAAALSPTPTLSTPRDTEPMSLISLRALAMARAAT
jgi:subtilisin family serine protease